MSDLDGNPEDKFSRDAAQLFFCCKSLPAGTFCGESLGKELQQMLVNCSWVTCPGTVRF